MWYRTFQINKLHILDGGLLDLAGGLSAIIFIIVSLFNAFRTKAFKFYLCLIVLIIVPAYIIGYPF
jgi:hypothetical protein